MITCRARLRMLTIGLLLGLGLAPLLWLGAAANSSAQSLPFTPTPEPPEPTASPSPLPTQPPTQTPVVVVVTATPTASPAPSATPLPPGYGRDRCDPNHSLQQPCALATETEIGGLNFTDGATDVFSFLLKGGRQYRVAASVGPAGGLDPTLEVFLAGAAEQPLASNDDERIGSPTAAVTITVQFDSWYLARVTNRAPGSPSGKTYSLSAHSVAPAGGPAPAAPTSPDELVGNAYDPAHAARLAWSVPYDLSMQCPDPRPGACYAGRHTFLLVPVKPGVPFTALTYDLGAGVDTLLTLYRPDPAQAELGDLPGWRAVAANDDIAPGWTLRSQVTITPDWPGLALLVVAPSDRADLPPIPVDGRPGRYRLILGSPDLPSVRAVLAAQHDTPPEPATPTARPTGQAAPAAVGDAPAQDVREVIKEACSSGLAIVGEQPTDLFAAAPPGADDRIAAYPPGAMVQLLGQCYRGWVKAQPADSVTPGWMWAANLRPETLASTPAPTQPLTGPFAPPASIPEPGMPVAAPPGTMQPQRAAGPSASVRMIPLTPAPLPSAAAQRPVARQVAVTICRAPREAGPCARPVAGMRVELLLAATRHSLAAGFTDADGRLALAASAPVGSQLLLRAAAMGFEAELAPDAAELTVRIQQGAS